MAYEIPRLLPEATVRAVCARLDANRTYLHYAPRSSFLLSGKVVWCELPLPHA